MRKAVGIMMFVLLVTTAAAQQVGMYAHYFYKPMVYNPAFTGLGDGVNAMLINRTQWAGIKGAPQLNIFTLDGKLSDDKAGLGVTMINDRKGITKRMGGNVSYSYSLPFNDETFLSFGLAVGVMDHTIDFSKAFIEDLSDPTLFLDVQRKTVFDANAGVAFRWTGLEVGLAIPQIAGNKVKYAENTNVRMYYTQSRHIMGSVKYKINLSEEKGMSIAPQFLMRYVANAPLQFDGNLNFEWRNKFWVGGTYKSKYAIGLNAGLHLYKQFSIGYSYDMITGGIGKYSGIAHELMINFRFGRREKDDEPSETDRKLDSLSTQVDDLKNQSEAKDSENAAYRTKVDSLNSKLNKSSSRISELERKIEELKQQQSQMGTSSQNTGQSGNNSSQGVSNQNQNQSILDQNMNKTMENNVWVITGAAQDFKNNANEPLKKSIYVIGGTFFYKDFAENEKKRIIGLGFKNAGLITQPSKEYNYVFLYKVNSKEEAFRRVSDAKEKGITDAWILVLE